MGLPAKWPGWLQKQSGLPWLLDGPGRKSRLPRGWHHDHHHYDAGHQPYDAAPVAFSGH